MLKRSLLLSGIVLAAMTGCAPQQANEREDSQYGAVSADTNRIEAHLNFLASDLLEGRDTGSSGHEIASLYIANTFKQYGLTPAGDDGSYMQRVPFRQAFLDQSSPTLTFSQGEDSIELSYPKDFIASANFNQEHAVTSAPLVFAGYGIVAPEYNQNDYEGLDVDGKVVVVLYGRPTSFPSEEGAHFGSSSEKAKHAVANGAVGILTISTPLAERVRPYQTLLNYLHTPRVSWLNKDGEPARGYEELTNIAYLHQDAAEPLFEGAPQSLENIFELLEDEQIPTGFALPFNVEMETRSEHRQISSPNVAAIVPGSDPELRDEYVVYSAHSDHIGFAKTVEKDKINNGAMDNSSGTAIMLETARMFSQSELKPKRSILFVAVTAEEKGLLGSDYFARNPTVDLGSMVANVNLDMPILTYPFADVIAFGANHSDMQASVAQAAEATGLTLSPDPWPEQALFTRSDHYSFVKQGVPSVFLVPGLTSSDPNIDGSKQFNKFIQSNYHRPSDDLNQEFHWEAAKTFAEVNYQIGFTLADQAERAAWNEGDFFGEKFAKDSK